MASVASANCMWLLGLVSCSLHRVKVLICKAYHKGRTAERKQKQYGVNPVVFKFDDYSQKLLLSNNTMNFGNCLCQL